MSERRPVREVDTSLGARTEEALLLPRIISQDNLQFGLAVVDCLSRIAIDRSQGLTISTYFSVHPGVAFPLEKRLRLTDLDPNTADIQRFSVTEMIIHGECQFSSGVALAQDVFLRVPRPSERPGLDHGIGPNSSGIGDPYQASTVCRISAHTERPLRITLTALNNRSCICFMHGNF